MLETHLRLLLRASRINPYFLIRSEIFPKATNARRNASRRLQGLSSSGHPYRRNRWPELHHRPHHRSEFYHSNYMRIWRKNASKTLRIPITWQLTF